MPTPELQPTSAPQAAPAPVSADPQVAKGNRSLATMGYAAGAASLSPNAKGAAAPPGTEDAANKEKERQAAARKGYTDLLGGFLGGKLYEVVQQNLSADKFLEFGKQGLSAGADALSKLVKPVEGSGIMDTKEEAAAVAQFSKALATWAGSFAEEWLKSEDGAKFRQAASEWVEGHPGIIVSAALAAAAVAVAANMDVPELKQKFKIGGGLTASTGIDFGKIRDLTVQGASAGLEYKKGDVAAGISYKAKVGDDGKVSHEGEAKASYDVAKGHTVSANGKLAADGSLAFGVGSLNNFGQLRMDSALGYRVPNTGDNSAFGSVKLRYGSDERNVTSDTSYDSANGKFTLGLGAYMATSGLKEGEKPKEGAPTPPPLESLRLGLNFAADRLSSGTVGASAEYTNRGYLASGSGTYDLDKGRMTDLALKLGYRNPTEFEAIVVDWKRSYKDKIPEDRFGLLLETTVKDFMIRGQAKTVLSDGNLAQAGGTLDVAKPLDKRISLIGGVGYGYQSGAAYSGQSEMDRGLWLRAGVQIDKVPVVVSFRPEDKAVTIGISIPFGR